MSALQTIQRLQHSLIKDKGLKYCLVSKDKIPYKLDNTLARPNNIADFVDFETIANYEHLDNYAGIGISIQASNVCAIDVDHCFSIKNNILSADDRALYCLDLFKDIAYCEFSFSGTGLRILFRQPNIENYALKYYIKNSNANIEYYQPSKSFRYVTITGNTIFDNFTEKSEISNELQTFLNEKMLRQQRMSKYIVNTTKEETKSYDELMKSVRIKYLKDMTFQNLWFTNAPGSGKDESERDYHLIAYLYDNITQDKDLIKQIFESSNFFKTKDWKHIRKWEYNNYRYFNYLYDTLRRKQ